jgi:hypothetical protein
MNLQKEILMLEVKFYQMMMYLENQFSRLKNSLSSLSDDAKKLSIAAEQVIFLSEQIQQNIREYLVK